MNQLILRVQIELSFLKLRLMHWHLSYRLGRAEKTAADLKAELQCELADLGILYRE